MVLAVLARSYERRVRYTQRRCVKKGRKRTQDDSGSDSEYEEVCGGLTHQRWSGSLAGWLLCQR
jgi:hypothetical protein